ncbi:hypothetical protein CDD83_5095 [Cordyceps sp. RAO-2017]|nr:hypothetical protein CDD83_5095 [Cordyceps sp. RAO-2017]
MSTAAADHGPEKRKAHADAPAAPKQSKKPRNGPAPTSLVGPHEAILAELEAKAHVLVASVISSTRIRKRIESAVAHLDAPSEKPRLVLLHARTAQVCKMITVVEHCKRILAARGKPWYQYNQLFDLPAEPKRADVVEETVLDKRASDSESDGGFEVMSSRIEKAVLPPPPEVTVKSMRVFLSVQPMTELKARSNVTLQTSEDTDTAT